MARQAHRRRDRAKIRMDDITVLVARVHDVDPAAEEEEDEWEDDFEEE